MIFNDRTDAAHQLIDVLSPFEKEHRVVMAIPRGGVPVAVVIAKKFGWDLDLIFTKKIGHPSNPELAIGSVSLDGAYIDNRFEMDEKWLQEEKQRIRKILKVKYDLLMQNNKPVDVAGRKVIIVDDGIATGSTVAVAIEMMRRQNAAEVMVAVPVASIDAARLIWEKADQFICLYTPQNFVAVGQFYRDFSQVSDEEVMEMMQKFKNSSK